MFTFLFIVLSFHTSSQFAVQLPCTNHESYISDGIMISLPFYSHLIFLYFIQCACICAYASACSLSLNFCCCFFLHSSFGSCLSVSPLLPEKLQHQLVSTIFHRMPSLRRMSKNGRSNNNREKMGAERDRKKLCIENNEEKPSFDMNIVHDVSLLFTLLAICAKFMYLDKNWRCTLLL